MYLLICNERFAGAPDQYIHLEKRGLIEFVKTTNCRITGIFELKDIQSKVRKCFECKKTSIHSDAHSENVRCPKCRSWDTRKVVNAY